MTGTTGANTPVWFRWEDAGFASAPDDSTNKAFGPNATVDTDEGSNNAVRVLNPDNIEAVDIVEQNFDGSFTISFNLADPWWLGAVFGMPSTVDNTDGTYTHTFDGTTPSTMAITEGFRTASNSRVLRGCLLSEVTVNTTVPELVEVTLTGAYAEEDKQSGAPADQPEPDYRVLKYSEARLDLDGTKVAYVQDAELTVTLNTNLIEALDSRTAVDFWAGVREPELTYSRIMDGDGPTELEDFYGGSTSVQDAVTTAKPMTLVFESAVNESALTFNMDGAFPNTYQLENMGDPQEAIQENLTKWVQTIDATADNDTSTAP